MMKGSAHQQDLTDAIEEMKNKALQLREEANLCLQRRIGEMDRKSDLRASRGTYIIWQLLLSQTTDQSSREVSPRAFERGTTARHRL
jgi:hypothetical protein